MNNDDPKVDVSQERRGGHGPQKTWRRKYVPVPKRSAHHTRGSVSMLREGVLGQGKRERVMKRTKSAAGEGAPEQVAATERMKTARARRTWVRAAVAAQDWKWVSDRKRKGEVQHPEDTEREHEKPSFAEVTKEEGDEWTPWGSQRDSCEKRLRLKRRTNEWRTRNSWTQWWWRKGVKRRCSSSARNNDRGKKGSDLDEGVDRVTSSEMSTCSSRLQASRQGSQRWPVHRDASARCKEGFVRTCRRNPQSQKKPGRTWDEVHVREREEGTPQRSMRRRRRRMGRTARGIQSTWKKTPDEWHETSGVGVESFVRQLVSNGYRRGRAVPTIFYYPVTDVRVDLHGDDFTLSGTEVELRKRQKKMRDWCFVQVRGIAGCARKTHWRTKRSRKTTSLGTRDVRHDAEEREHGQVRCAIRLKENALGCRAPYKKVPKRTWVMCGEEELVRRVHTLFVRSAQQVQVVYELQVQEERERVRQEVRKVERENQGRGETLTWTWTCGWRSDIVEVCGSGHVVIGVRIVQCHAIMFNPLFWNSHILSQFSICCQAVSIHHHSSCSHFVHIFCTAKTVIWGVVFTPPVSCKRSICNKVNEFKKFMPWRIVPNTCITGHPVLSVLGSSPSWLS